MSLVTSLSPERIAALQFASGLQTGTPAVPDAIKDKSQSLIQQKDWAGIVHYLSNSPLRSVGAADYQYIFSLTPGQQDVWKFLLCMTSPDTPADSWTTIQAQLYSGFFSSVVDILAANKSPLKFTAQELQDIVDPGHTIQPASPAAPGAGSAPDSASAPKWTIPITWSVGAYGDAASWGTGAAKWTVDAGNAVADWTTGSANTVADWTKGSANTITGWATNSGNTAINWITGTGGSAASWVKGAGDTVAGTASTVASGLGQAFNPTKW